ncbi:MAG: ribosome maturation factor RimP [Candidatus Dormibacteraeota bacterium]|nr:ribosome maturation factor RimP [Candidatus Dormibacteraeota bacterium]
MPNWPISAIAELLRPSLAHLGYSIYALEQAGRSGRTLRLAIDKSEGFISIADCERVSHVAGPLLDQADLIPDSYTLEVSSPGAERALRDRADYERFVGRLVNVRARAGNSEVALEGTLLRVGEEAVTVAGAKGAEIEVAWRDVLSAHLVAKP